MAHNLTGELVFMVVLYLAVHVILDDLPVLVRNKSAVLIAHTTHHHGRFLTAVLVADSQLHVGRIVGRRTCHCSQRFCRWVSSLWLLRMLRCRRSLINPMTLTIVSQGFLVPDALQILYVNSLYRPVTHVHNGTAILKKSLNNSLLACGQNNLLTGCKSHCTLRLIYL